MISKKKNKNLLKRIKSQYILKQVFENLMKTKKLNLIRYNKQIQKIFDFKLNDYKECNNILIQDMRSIPEFNSDPKNLKEEINLIDKIGYKNTISSNAFIIFKSFHDKYYLVYGDNSNIIISYDLTTNTKLKQVPKTDEVTSCFNHFPDVYKKRDLIMTIHSKSKSIKVWDFRDMKLIYHFNKINKSGYLNVACFFNDNNQIYILSSNHRYTGKNVEPIKIYDLKGNKIKELKDSNENVFFLDYYYDKKQFKKYIIAGFAKYIRAYDPTNNTIYNKYKDKYNAFHREALINDYESTTKLIESSTDGNVRIWDFHKAELIKRIKINERETFGICLWNKESLFVGTRDKIVLVNINTGEIIYEYDYTFESKYNDYGIIAIKKLNSIHFGECLVTKAYDKDVIQIFSAKNK